MPELAFSYFRMERTLSSCFTPDLHYTVQAPSALTALLLAEAYLQVLSMDVPLQTS